MMARKLVTLMVTCVITGPVAGQTASIDARVDISTTALSIATTADLDFGAVTPGAPTTINPRTSPNAGSFEVHGARGAEFTLSFAIPPALTVGPHSMPISFGANTGCAIPYIVGLRGSCIFFNPSLTYVTTIPNLPPPWNRWLFWLGGTVSPTPTQNPGVYQGTITMTVAYTGN